MSSDLAAPRAVERPTTPVTRHAKRPDGTGALERALTRVVRLTRPRLHRPALEDAGAPAIDPAAYATLHWVAELPNCRLTALATVLGVDLSTASRQVRALESTGLLERSADPEDQRALRLALSPAGAQLLERTREARERALSGLLADWSGRDIDELARLLDRLALRLGGEWVGS